MSRRKRSGRPPRHGSKTGWPKGKAAPIVIIELAKHHNSGVSANADFARIGLSSAMVLQHPCCGSSRFFTAFRAPSGQTDCTIMEFAGLVVAYKHGTDCDMVKSIARDMATGEMSQWVNCSRFAAGGAFRCVEIPEEVDLGRR